MDAVYFPARGEVRAGVVATPEPGVGEVLLRIAASGLCHTDVEVLHGNYGTSAYPVVPGHEFAGEVVALGESVEGWQTGDRVVVDPNLECGHCRACQRGWAHLCENLGAYGVTVNGGFAEYCKVKASALHGIGDLSYTRAALAEPTGCVLNGLSPLVGRDIANAAIFGAGPMGLLIALALKARGVEAITMFDPDESRLALAEACGVMVDDDTSANKPQSRHAHDLVVDATGIPSVAQQLPELTANGGACLYFGVCPADARIEISPFDIFRRQLSIFGTHSLNHNIPEALEVLQKMGDAADKLVTHQLSPQALADVMSGNKLAGSMKIQMVLPG